MAAVSPQGTGDLKGAEIHLFGAPQEGLPDPLTSFLGRAGELDAIDAQLRKARLLTLLGTGGVGKTRLAIEVARSFEADAVFVDLAAIDREERVVAAAASALGVRETAHRSLLEAVTLKIGTRSLLLVLDNCEHVVAAAAEAATTILRECPHVTILATSRELLNCPGEAVFRVPTLAPETSAELFVARAELGNDAESERDDVPALIEGICAQLDGVPLAIELAAARTRLLTLEQIRAGLDDRLTLLAAGPRTVAPRQQSVGASVEWSYALLDATEQRVLQFASVFLGGFTIEAIQFLCDAAGIPPATTLATVGQLVDKSLVNVDLRGAAGRFSLLETIRQFGFEQLDDVDAALLQHARYFARALARGAEAELEYFARVDPEYPNAQRAMETALARRDLALCMRLVWSLAHYWIAERHPVEGLRYCGHVLGFADNAEDRTFLLALRSTLGYQSGDWAITLTEGVEAEAAIPGLRDPAVQVRTTMLLVNLVDVRGTPVTTADLALQLATDLGLELERLQLLSDITWIRARENGELDGAEETLDAVIAKARDLGHTGVHMLTRQRRALLEVWRGSLTSARLALEAGAREAEAYGSVVVLAESLGLLAGVQEFNGFPASADASRAKLAKLADDVGLIGIFQRMVGDLTVHFARAEWAELEAVITPIAGSFNSGVSLWSACIAWRSLARTNLGDFAGAQADLDLLGPIMANPFPAGFQLLATGWLAVARGDAAAAEDALFEGLPHIRPNATLGFVSAAYVTMLAATLAQRARLDDAARAHGVALRLADEAGASWECGLMRALPRIDDSATADALGQDVYDERLREGQAMAFEEFVAYIQRGRGRRKRPTSGWEALTPTEQQVVDLVVEGATNAEIATKLFMSVPTVKSHLTHVYAKLAVRNRAQLTAEAARR